jgi:hypothetical protein
MLAAFCTLAIEFSEDISEQYPEEKDIAIATKALKLLKKTNPRLVHTTFMKQINAELRKGIMAEDEDYVLSKAKELDVENSVFWIFDKHWSAMSETNKHIVWKYIKSLVLMAERVDRSGF